jgi:hypothetical protein
VLVLCAEFFGTRAVLLVLQPVAACGAAAAREGYYCAMMACDSARCLERFCCCARDVLLHAGLLVFQRVAAAKGGCLQPKSE